MHTNSLLFPFKLRGLGDNVILAFLFIYVDDSRALYNFALFGDAFCCKTDYFIIHLCYKKITLPLTHKYCLIHEIKHAWKIGILANLRAYRAQHSGATRREDTHTNDELTEGATG